MVGRHGPNRPPPPMVFAMSARTRDWLDQFGHDLLRSLYECVNTPSRFAHVNGAVAAQPPHREFAGARPAAK